MEEKVKVGKIINTFGIKGELKIRSFTDLPDERFKVGALLYVQDKEFKVATHRIHKGMDLISFENHRDINLVEKYKGYDLYALKDDVELDEDEVWLSDFIGMKVYNKGEYLGPVTNLYDNVNQQLLEVDYHGEPLLIPYVDAFIKEKDFSAGRIDVELIKGFIDED